MASTARPLRADAARNRERIIDAARRVFAEHGVTACVDDIARVAGVGVGTLYRRFPTKDELLEAILEDGSMRLIAALEDAAGHDDAWQAFSDVVTVFAEHVARDRGFYQVVHQSTHLKALSLSYRELILAAIAPVLSRAQAAGVVRADLVVDDVPSLCVVAARMPPWRLEREPELWRRYLSVIVDGMRPEAAHPIDHPPPLPL